MAAAGCSAVWRWEWRAWLAMHLIPDQHRGNDFFQPRPLANLSKHKKSLEVHDGPLFLEANPVQELL